jgi:hypothetical protein
VLDASQATIDITDAENGLLTISIPASVTATLAPGRYYDSLRIVTDQGDLSTTIWQGVVNVDADPFG